MEGTSSVSKPSKKNIGKSTPMPLISPFPEASDLHVCVTTSTGKSNSVFSHLEWCINVKLCRSEGTPEGELPITLDPRRLFPENRALGMLGAFHRVDLWLCTSTFGDTRDTDWRVFIELQSWYRNSKDLLGRGSDFGSLVVTEWSASSWRISKFWPDWIG